MRRALGWMLALTLLTGGAAACGSSSGDKASGTTVADGSDNGNGEVASSNKAVQEYCTAVDDYVDKVKAAKGDASKASALVADGQELSKKAAALGTAGLDADDLKAVQACTKKTTDALTG